MKTYIFLTVLAIGLWTLDVKAQTSLNQANRQYEMMAYTKAIELYEQALKENLKDSTKINTLIKLGHSYHQIRDTPNAERVYRSLLGEGKTVPRTQSNCYLYYAQALASNGKYDEAKEVYERYNQAQQEDQRGKEFTKLYANVAKLSKNTSSYTVEPLDNINTNRAEFSPTYYKKGLVFVSARNEGLNVKRVYGWNQTAFLDLYEIPDLSVVNSAKTSRVGGAAANKSAKAKGVYLLGSDEYTSPTANDSKTPGNYRAANGTAIDPLKSAKIESQNMGKALNSKYHEGPVAFFKDGNKMLFTRNNYLDGKYKTSKDGTNKLKLYSADWTDNEWGKLKELPFNSDEYSVGHPSLSKDDKLLYFVSDMPGGFGGTDIYVSKYENNNWSVPINLGPAVNSKGNEMFPFADEQGNLYFSSDGHAGLGGLDMFYAKLIEGVMAKKPKNLGTPMNSTKDDFGIITDGERKSGFFSSNRRRGGADDDLFRFERTGPMDPCQDLIVNVIDAETKSIIANASVELVNKDESNPEVKTLNTDSEGNLRLCLDSDMNYVFRASNEGYLNNSLSFATKDLDISELVKLEIPLEKVKPKPAPVKTFTLRGLVTTQKDRKPISGVKVLLHNECDGSMQEAVTDENGTYKFEVPSGCDYSIEALKDNLGTMGSKVKGGETSEANITMFEKGDVIKIDNIYYDLNKWDIRNDATTELNKLVQLMNKYPKMRIEFGSHTDSRSSTKYNKTLSTKRAKAAVTYIVKQGVNAKRIIAAGYGESKLVNKCKDGTPCTEEEHQQNRRTEIKILSL